MTIEFKAFETRPEASYALAQDIEYLLVRATEENESVGFMVSGGSSPLTVYQHLRKASLAWDKIDVIPSDERCVKIGSDQSNAKMIQRELLQGQASEASFHSLVSNDGKPLIEDDIKELEKHFAQPFAVSLLGMGEDGHTASLFPDAVEIEEAIIGDQFYYQLSPDHLKQKRVSLSASTLINSDHIILLIFGERKKAIYELASRPGDALDLPVRVLLQQQQAPVTVYWAP